MSLPPDVYHHIFEYLPSPDLCRCRLLNRELEKTSRRYLRPSRDNFVKACLKDRQTAVEFLIDNGMDPSIGINHALTACSRGGNIEIVRLLLQHPAVNPATQDNLPIRWASKYGYTEIALMLLNESKVIDAMIHSEYPTVVYIVYEACYTGNIELLDAVLGIVGCYPELQHQLYQSKDTILRVATQVGDPTILSMLQRATS